MVFASCTHGCAAPVLAGLGILLLLAACDIAPPKQQLDGRLRVTRKRPHKKPGASLEESMLCSCLRCEVAMCCNELEHEQQQSTQKCTSYDFESCGGLAVSSCEGRCFQHRWRTEQAVGCQASRPDACCYAQSPP